MAFIKLSPTFSLFLTNILKLFSVIYVPALLHEMPLLFLNYGWSNVAKFYKIILCVQRNNYFDSTNYLYIQRIIYIFSERITFTERIIYMFDEIIISIQRIIYILNELFTYSTKELVSSNQLNIFVQRMNWKTPHTKLHDLLIT